MLSKKRNLKVVSHFYHGGKHILLLQPWKALLGTKAIYLLQTRIKPRHRQSFCLMWRFASPGQLLSTPDDEQTIA
jgi:hypothetical protein